MRPDRPELAPAFSLYFLAVALLLAGVGCVAAWSRFSPISLELPIQGSAIAADSGHAYLARLHRAVVFNPLLEPPLRVDILEDGTALGPEDNNYGPAINQGRGSYYIHEHRLAYFSTPDNSDPRANHRTYSVRYQLRAWRIIVAIFLLTALAHALVGLWLRGRRIPLDRAALLAGSILFSLLAVDVGLRFVFVAPEIMGKPHPMGLGIAEHTFHFRQLEYAVDLAYRRNAFREDPYPFYAKKDGLRVLVLGDSFVEGIGVGEDSRLTELLQRGLRESPGNAKARVFNAGQQMTGPADYLENLAGFGVSLQPDLVVACVFMGNDFQGGRQIPANPAPHVRQTPPLSHVMRPTWSAASILTLEYVRALAWQFLAPLQPPPTLLYRRTNTDNVWAYIGSIPKDRASLAANTGLTSEELDRRLAGMDPEFVQASLQGGVNPAFLYTSLLTKAGPQGVYYNDDDFSGVLRATLAMRDICETRSIRFLVVVIPDLLYVYGGQFEEILKQKMGFITTPGMFSEVAALHDRLVDELRKADIPCLELTGPMRAAPRQAYFWYDEHWTDEGHAIAAREIQRWIQGSGLLGRPDAAPRD